MTVLQLAFGPLTYEVELDAGIETPAWAPRHASHGAGGRRVMVVRCRTIPEVTGEGRFEDAGYVAVHGANAHAIYVEAGREARWITAFAMLVSHDAPSVGALVIHCAAVRIDGGVALLLAKGGTGKTTFARNAGARSFAHNAVIVDAREPASLDVWALPFAGDPQLDLDAEGVAKVRVVALLERGEAPGFEWIPRSEATTSLARACVRAPAVDPWARERFMLAFALVARVAVGRMRTTRRPRDLESLDEALSTENRP